MFSPLLVGDLLAWFAENIGVSVAGVILLFVAYEGWRAMSAGRRAAGWVRYAIVVAIALGALNLAGIVPTIRFGMAWSMLVDAANTGWEVLSNVLG